MKISILISIVAVLLSACATKIYRAVPALTNPNKYSEVVIIRNKSIWGGGVGIGIQFDGYKIASLSTGHHIRARVNPGQHAVGTMSGSITLTFEAGQTYYFLSGIGMSGDQNIERLDEADAKNWLANSKEVLLN